MHHTDLRLSTAAHQLRASSVKGNLSTYLPAVVERIRHQSELRFFVDGTRNLGHQAATLDLARYLVELSGFAGQATFVFSDYGLPHLGGTAEKIALLAPELEDQPFGAGWARLVPITDTARFTKPCCFGFTGGADDMGINYAQALNLDWFARIQPFLWDDEDSQKSDIYYEASRLERRDGAMLYLSDDIDNFRMLPLPVIRDTPIDSIEDYVWPVYGLQHFRDHIAQLMAVLTAAAIEISQRMKRRIVLRSFCPLTEMDGWAAKLPTLGPLVTVDMHGLTDAMSFRSALRTAKFAPVIEGQSSANMMLNSGRPFLQLQRPERRQGFGYLKITRDPALQMRAEILDNLVIRVADGQASAIPDLVDLLMASMDPESDLSLFFRKTATDLHHSGLNKIEITLSALEIAMSSKFY